jgi:hypothetical protein
MKIVTNVCRKKKKEDKCLMFINIVKTAVQ